MTHRHIAKAACLDWKKELRKYIAMYRSLPHSTTDKSPVELNYSSKFRGKLSDFTLEFRDDLDVRDADERHGARYSNVDIGGEVLVKQDRHHLQPDPIHDSW